MKSYGVTIDTKTIQLRYHTTGDGFNILLPGIILEFSIFCLVTYQCISLFEEVSCVLDDAFTKVLFSLPGLVPKPPFKMAQEVEKYASKRPWKWHQHLNHVPAVACQFPAAHAPDALQSTWAIFPAIYHQPVVHTVLWKHGARRFTRFTNCQCHAWSTRISFCDPAVQLQCFAPVQLQRTVPGLLLEGSLLAQWLFSCGYFGQWLSARELVDRTLYSLRTGSIFNVFIFVFNFKDRISMQLWIAQDVFVVDNPWVR